MEVIKQRLKNIFADVSDKNLCNYTSNKSLIYSLLVRKFISDFVNCLNNHQITILNEMQALDLEKFFNYTIYLILEK